MFGSEWYREKVSKLERSLRLPVFFVQGIWLFFTRTFLIWFFSGFVLYFIFKSKLLSYLGGLILTITYELFTVRSWLLKKILPRHQNNLKIIRSSYKKRKTFSKQELVIEIEKCIALSSWSIIRFVYGVIPSWGWEIVFRLFNPLITSSNIPYQDLLVGFTNKSIEADQKLWEIAQIKNKNKQKKKLTEYVKNYGSRGDDFDLGKPTLRENKKAIKHMLTLYAKTPSPKETLKKQKQKRLKAKSKAIKNLRIPKGLFTKILNQVQKNVVLRGNRRFYEFQSEFYLRQLILELAKRLKIKNIFDKNWRKIKSGAN